MRQFLSLIALATSLTLGAEVYTIHFNSSETGNDGTQATTEIAKLIDYSTFDFVIGTDTAKTNNIYVGKNGYGAKGGTGSIGGKLALVLDTAYTIKSITLYAAAANKADTAATKGISVCGREIKWRSPRMELQPYEITLNAPLDTLTFAALTPKNCRFYIEHIDLDIEDTYEHRAKMQMPTSYYKFPSMEYDATAPAEDAESFEVMAKGFKTPGLELTMKNGTTFQVTPTTLPAEGGEFTISYSTTTKPSFFDIKDTCIIRGVGINGSVITKTLAVSTMVYEPKPYDVDSSEMFISIAPQPQYYQPIDRLKDSVLKSTLATIINRGPRYRYGSGRNHTWAGFYYTDRSDTADNLVLDMYSNNQRYFNPEKPNASVSGFDIEHMFPKSWWGRTENKAYCDLFHLVPGDASANRSKSNHAPGVPTDTTFWNGSFATGPDAVHGLQRVFCPADEYKGDFARAYFYIACCYGDELTWVSTAGSEPAAAMDNNSYLEFRPWLYELLLEWHHLDPVSEKETKRAIEVNKIQGNRNPFIDYPELVDYIWGDKSGTAVELNSLKCSYEIETAVTITDAPIVMSIKRLENGEIVIIRNQDKFNLMGTRIQ